MRGLLAFIRSLLWAHSKPCSRCGKPRDRGDQRLCKKCHRENMRDWRADRHYVRKAA